MDSPHSVCQGGKTVFAKHSARAPRLLRGTGCGLGSAAPKGCTRTPGAAQGWMLPGRDWGSRAVHAASQGLGLGGGRGTPESRWVGSDGWRVRGRWEGVWSMGTCKRNCAEDTARRREKSVGGEGGTNPRGTAAALLKRQGQRRAEHVSA